MELVERRKWSQSHTADKRRARDSRHHAFCGTWLPTLLFHQGFSGQREGPVGSPSHKAKAVGTDFKLVLWFFPVLHREGDSLVEDISSAYLSCTQT